MALSKYDIIIIDKEIFKEGQRKQALFLYMGRSERSG